MMGFTRLLASVSFSTLLALVTVPQVCTYTVPIVTGPAWCFLQLGKNATMDFTYELSTGRVLNYIAFHRLEGDETEDLLVQSNKKNPNGRFSIVTSQTNNSFTFTITDVHQHDDGAIIMCTVNDGVENGKHILSLDMSYCNVTSFVNNGPKTTCKSDCLPYANVSILVNSVVVASGSGSATTSDLSIQECMDGSGICVADNGMNPVAKVRGCDVPQGNTTTAPVVHGPAIILLHIGMNPTMNFSYELSTGRVLSYVAFHRLENDKIGELMVQSNKENPNGRFSIDTTSMTNNSFSFTITDVQQEDDGMIICIVDDGVENGSLVSYLVILTCNVTSFVYNNSKTTCKSDCFPTANVSILINSVVVASGLGSATTSDVSSQACMDGSGVCVADNGIDPVAEIKGCEVIKTEDLLSIGLIAGISVGAVLLIGFAIVIGCHCRNQRLKQWQHTTLN